MEYSQMESSLDDVIPSTVSLEEETSNRDIDRWNHYPHHHQQENGVSFKRQTSSTSTNNEILFGTNSPSIRNHHHHRRKSTSLSGLTLSWSTQTIAIFTIWYMFSFLTLFFNKYILMDDRNDPTILGSCQLLMCIIGGYFHTKIPIGMITSTKDPRSPSKGPIFTLLKRRLSKLVILVGCLRFSTLLLGLVALWYAPVSFAETVKSSAPVFTVILTRIVLGETASIATLLSLIPVVAGLVICSAYELSFSFPALMSALATNLSECLQNVFSKKLLVTDRHLDPHHLQLLTSISSLVIQIPCLLLLVDFQKLWSTLSSDSNLAMTYILNGFSFHCQSLSEYMLLSQISPVTHSVANTTKRALLILLSVLTFGNTVTIQSWVGTIIVFCGVYLYNKSRSNPLDSSEDDKSTLLSHQGSEEDV